VSDGAARRIYKTLHSLTDFYGISCNLFALCTHPAVRRQGVSAYSL
jgi:hypothetical protein